MTSIMDFLNDFWKVAKWLIVFSLIGIIIVQRYQINSYKESDKEWRNLQKIWREKLDTCMERNARIYDQLYEFQDIRIKQLLDEKEEEINKGR